MSSSKKKLGFCFKCPIVRAKPRKAQDAREDGNSPLPSLEITQTMFIDKKSNFLQCTLGYSDIKHISPCDISYRYSMSYIYYLFMLDVGISCQIKAILRLFLYSRLCLLAGTSWRFQNYFRSSFGAHELFTNPRIVFSCYWFSLVFGNICACSVFAQRSYLLLITCATACNPSGEQARKKKQIEMT